MPAAHSFAIARPLWRSQPLASEAEGPKIGPVDPPGPPVQKLGSSSNQHGLAIRESRAEGLALEVGRGLAKVSHGNVGPLEGGPTLHSPCGLKISGSC